MAHGRFTVGEQYLLGPQDSDGTFRLAKVASIHVKNRLVKQAIAGQVRSFCDLLASTYLIESSPFLS